MRAGEPKRDLTPVVGIGASAGGLEALEIFLSHVPADSGMAFVIVQHLDPGHVGVLAELLQRVTPMKVSQVTDRMRVEPNCVYVIPPNKDMSLLHGVLHLLAPNAPRGLRLPINFFFRSLAEDLKERSIGVILSGMGSDGTQGLKAIKEKAGSAFVQDPATAKFSGMPSSAIEAGLADITASVEEMPGKILDYYNRSQSISKPGLSDRDKHGSNLDKIIILLRAEKGHDFSQYKSNTLYRRIERRMGIHQIDRMSTYVRFLRDNPKEVELLFKEFLIGVTAFFRDSEVWDQLKESVLRPLVKARPSEHTFRIWAAGCSTGEEAYSMAILLKEVLEEEKVAEKHAIQIFATDLDSDAIERARIATFPETIAVDVSTERLQKYFLKIDTGFQVSRAIRESVTFAVQDVIMDPPFTKLDLVICRNLLIYLMPELQKKLIPLFHYSLNPGGFLFLGGAETISGFTEIFSLIEGKGRIYRRLDYDLRYTTVVFPTSSLRTFEIPMKTPKQLGSMEADVSRLLLQKYAPAAVLVNSNGDILYISGRTGKFLEPAAGKANWNVFVMARSGLKYELNSAFRSSLKQQETIVCRGIRIDSGAGPTAVDVTIQPIQDPESLNGLTLIVFRESPLAIPEAAAITNLSEDDARRQLEAEITQLRQELHRARAELQEYQEEARSANEELQSTNEELQSSNEELTTSKEEMQSMNEELQTLNGELQSKVDDMSRLNSDLKNLIDSTELATVFLDTYLQVRLFTAGSNNIFKLRPSDVGRPITDIASVLIYPELEEDSQTVIRSLAALTKEVATQDNRWFLVRIVPYRTLENFIDGVAITFTNVTASRLLETTMKETQAQLERQVSELEARYPNETPKQPDVQDGPS